MIIKNIVILSSMFLGFPSHAANEYTQQISDKSGKKVVVWLECGDLLAQTDTQIIVNAANTMLRGGGGIDGVIHRFAGPNLLEELVARYPHGGQTGNAYISNSHNLKDDGIAYIIHAIGPDCRINAINQHRKRYLGNAYKNSLAHAVRLTQSDKTIKKIAFPSISTGIYGYPLQEAAHVAIDAIVQFIQQSPQFPLDQVTFVFKDLQQDAIMQAYQTALAKYKN